MTEEALSYYFPYTIDKQHHFRHFVEQGRDAFCKRHVPGYDGTNVGEFLYNKSGLSKEEIHDFEYLYENYAHWEEWFKNGKNIFSFQQALLSLLDKTDVSEITPDKFHLPYDTFYLSLKPLHIKIANGREEVIEGVYIDHNIWNGHGEHPEGYCDLSFYFVGNFKQLFLEYIPHVKSRLEDTSGAYDELPVGSFWNVWLSFEKKEGRENVKQAVAHFIQNLQAEILPKEHSLESGADTDFYNATVELLTNTINLVINCLLYLSQPTEKVEVEKRFPTGLPGNFDKQLSFAKTDKETKKIEEKINQLGFTKIRYVGQSFKRTVVAATADATVKAHWRRGHWRNQKFGEKLLQDKMIWIMPTIVNSHIGDPLKGHIYDIEEK
ncbi:hypothetical protein [Chitinophaga nivalis]|uniref:Uncharacterized protein n=1 Tax=Chitinophaga nivalis TaxID=2991709 RepID=A0ABT3IHQ5_9BACT|nr:hypothetical protein [Chitinophaga nivalis]MCW3466816.1 hypothetical protein [Chitinophaga nivalis]MCW3483493.1 hypothetical protein [Chitinophaga nivalis]